MSDNIMKCTRCEKNLIFEEIENHTCNPRFSGIIQIGISYLFKGKTNKNGDKIIIAKGFDGKLYQLVECRHNPPHVTKYPIFTDLPHQPIVNTNNNSREDNSTQISNRF